MVGRSRRVDWPFGGGEPHMIAAAQAAVAAGMDGADIGAPLETGDDADGSTPLHLAAVAGWTRFAHALLDAGHPVDPVHARTGVYGSGFADTPLTTAVRQQQYAMVRLLAEAGADPLARVLLDGGDATAMHVVAAMRPLPDAPEQIDPVVAALRAMATRPGAVDALDEEGRTPILQAAVHGAPAMVEALIAGGADTMIGDADGETPLLAALRRRPVSDDARRPIIGLLLNAGHGGHRLPDGGASATVAVVERWWLAGDPRTAAVGWCLADRSNTGWTKMSDTCPVPADPAHRTWCAAFAAANIDRPWGMRLLAALGGGT